MFVLWFQYNLIFITLLIFIIHLIYNEKCAFYILINLKLFGIFFTYSNYNFILFSKYNYYTKYTFGRFFEIIPYCIAGYILGYLNLMNIIQKNIIISINIFLPILIFILKYEIFLEIKGFLFQGLKLYASSISIFFIFSLIPCKKIGNKFIIKLIEFISNHTAGIYFIHTSLYYFFREFLLIENKKLIGSIIIYFTSFFISVCGKITFQKTNLINLFQ
jgi:surface polysaccharide O-acyltransferase-like enzyme